MEKLKVIFRKEYNEYTKRWEVIAFMPESSANYGNITCFDKTCGHGEATYGYYLKTRKATPEEYAELLSIMKRIYTDNDNSEYEGNFELVVKQRLHYDDLINKAWNRRLNYA